MNSAPVGGLFSVDPSRGVEVTTNFQFIASNWLDDDLPLEYSFAYYDLLVDNQKFVKAFSTITHISEVKLSQGSLSTNYSIYCLVYVADSEGATTNLTSTVYVSPILELNQALDDLYAKVQETVDASTMSNLLSAGNSLHSLHPLLLLHILHHTL